MANCDLWNTKRNTKGETKDLYQQDMMNDYECDEKEQYFKLYSVLLHK